MNLFDFFETKQIVSDTTNVKVFETILLLLSANTQFPTYDDNFPFKIDEIRDPEDKFFSRTLQLNNQGLPVNSVLDWNNRIQRAAKTLHDILNDDIDESTQRLISSIHFRILIFYSLIYSNRSHSDFWRIVNSFIKMPKQIVKSYHECLILPVDFVKHCTYSNQTLNALMDISANNVEYLIDEFYKICEIAESYAKKAKYSNTIVEILKHANTCKLLYSSATYIAVQLLKSNNTVSDDLAKDLGVIEEFRVTCSETLFDSYSSFVSRYITFFGDDNNKGKSVTEAIRRTNLAIKAQVNIYPEKVLADLEAIGEADFQSQKMPDDDIEFMEFQYQFESKLLPSFESLFMSNEQYKAFEKLRGSLSHSFTINLPEEWNGILYGSDPLQVSRSDPKFKEGWYSIYEIVSEDLLSIVLGGKFNYENITAEKLRPIKVYSNSMGQLTKGKSCFFDL